MPATIGSALADLLIKYADELNKATNNIIPEIGERVTDVFGYQIGDNTLEQSKYDFRYRTFPADIGNDYVGHYMVININVPVTATGGGNPRTSYRANQTILQNDYSKVDALRYGNAESNVGNGVTGDPFSIPRYTRRIAESIAIFMPTPMMYTTTNDYAEISLTALGSSIAAGGAGALGGIFGESAGRFASGIVSGFTGAVTTFGGMMGHPINPRVEVIFSRTQLRQFVFEFLLAPRNQIESDSMKKIIDTLRYHSVPELDENTAGFTYVPPAEFDFTFYHKGEENKLIPRINTCVVDRIEVDYAPTGVYSTFSNGHPVLARLSLGVREVEPLHKRRVLQGF
jgi:hypothetical protein